jgi:hypothetical protein
VFAHVFFAGNGLIKVWIVTGSLANIFAIKAIYVQDDAMSILLSSRFSSMALALRAGLAIVALAGVAVRSTAGEIEVPVTANSDIRNLDAADQNPLGIDAVQSSSKGIWQLVVRASTSAETQSFKTYLQADLEGQASPDRPLDGAKLVLIGVRRDEATASRPVSLTLYGITDNDDEWTEGWITWNNAPKNDTESVEGVKAEGTVRLAEVQVEVMGEGEVVEFSGEELTKYLNWKAGALPDAYGTGPARVPEATFILVASPKSGTLRFYSRQHKAKDPAETSLLVPRLVVQQPAP